MRHVTPLTCPNWTSAGCLCPATMFTAMAWGDRITDEQLDELLARAEGSQTVKLRIEQFRDLVRQAKAVRAEVDTTDATRFRWIANPKSNWIVGPCLPDNAPMGCGEDWELDELRATVDAAMRDDMNSQP